ncbi:hypothetical protein AC578_737 [Pseudocercospora eumusae]|uniref:Uncharacterized protein n=1 Tax=Pseudocercospora eumusae TaxID=321146 RepID=A0A139HN08_9PEZI|nr:hypothetical protein AC578_737 [Pseudocercospora eumusae]
MSRAAKATLDRVFTHIKSAASRKKGLFSKAAEAGTRAAPARGGKHDKQVGGRIDYGDKHQIGEKLYRRVKFQLNKDADDKSVRELAKQSHKIWAEADVQIDPPPDDEDQATEKAYEDLRKDLEDKAKKGSRK